MEGQLETSLIYDRAGSYRLEESRLGVFFSTSVIKEGVHSTQGHSVLIQPVILAPQSLHAPLLASHSIDGGSSFGSVAIYLGGVGEQARFKDVSLSRRRVAESGAMRPFTQFSCVFRPLENFHAAVSQVLQSGHFLAHLPEGSLHEVIHTLARSEHVETSAHLVLVIDISEILAAEAWNVGEHFARATGEEPFAHAVDIRHVWVAGEVHLVPCL